MPHDLNALGGFFSVELHQPASEPAPPWHSMAELVGDPAVLTERIEQVRRTLAAGRPLATIEPRVATSIGQLGLATRLLSPALASAASGAPIDLDWTTMRWQPGAGGAFPLSVQLTSATGFAAVVLHSMSLLNTAINRVNPVSPLILWGNVGSALNGAATMLARLRPGLAETGYDLARSVLVDGPLAMANPLVGPGFRRQSCCLLYRASPYGRAAICPDCVLGPG
jgi:hypothetical protein